MTTHITKFHCDLSYFNVTVRREQTEVFPINISTSYISSTLVNSVLLNRQWELRKLQLYFLRLKCLLDWLWLAYRFLFIPYISILNNWWIDNPDVDQLFVRLPLSDGMELVQDFGLVDFSFWLVFLESLDRVVRIHKIACKYLVILSKFV